MRKAAVIISMLMIMSASACYADDAQLRSEINELKSRIAELEKRLDQKEATQAPAQQAISEGLEFGVSGTMIVQNAFDSNQNGTTKMREDVLDGSYSTTLEISKEFGDYGNAYIDIETGDGAGVEDNLTVFSNVNYDADDSNNNIYVNEFWYEQSILDDAGSLMAGKIDPTCLFDENAAAYNECTQFLGRMFRNSPVIEFPAAAPGVKAGYEFNPTVSVDAGAFDSNAD